MQRRLTGAHPGDVALECIDLAWSRESIRRGWARSQVGKVLVEKRDGRPRRGLQLGVAQVGVEARELARGQQALVDDRREEKHGIESPPRPRARRSARRRNPALDSPGRRPRRPRRPTAGRTRAPRRAPFARRGEVDGHLAPAERTLPGGEAPPARSSAPAPPSGSGCGRGRRSPPQPRPGSGSWSRRTPNSRARARRKPWGRLSRTPAPSPVVGSAPTAPRCSRSSSAASPSSTTSWRGSPSSRATQATPHRIVLVGGVVEACPARCAQRPVRDRRDGHRPESTAGGRFLCAGSGSTGRGREQWPLRWVCRRSKGRK